MTMQELAKLANVSVSTVSKAFSDADDVGTETKKQIFTLAKKHGCYKKFYKGKNLKRTVAIICPELESNYFIHFVLKLQEILEKNNCFVIVSCDHFSVSLQAELINYFDTHLKVDGILVFELKNRIKKRLSAPIVSLFSTTDPFVDSITINFESAILESVRLLHNFGHKKIAFLGESLTTIRAQHFQKAMTQIGVKDPYIIESNYRFEKAGEDGIKQLLSNTTDCTAIICAYDNIAYGAIKRLKKLGYKIPDDFSVIGIDNISAAEHIDVPLSSIGTNSDDICMIAWDLLYKKINTKTSRSSQQIVINSNLIVRDSVKNLKL